MGSGRRGKEQRNYLKIVFLPCYTLAMEVGDWIAIFGREPTLSAWELVRLCPSDWQIVCSKSFATFSPVEGKDLPGLQRRAGGLVKVGIVRGVIKNLQELETILSKQWPDLIPPGSTARCTFGLSAYDAHDEMPRKVRQDFQAAAQRLKKIMVAQGRSARLVVSRESTLPASALVQSKMLERGFELLILPQPEGLAWGTTIACQDIGDYGARDVGRPSRDTLSGMLPPKVAQFLINLTQPKSGDTLLDPFCGSGTILQEAALMGIENRIGFDISQKAVAATKTNLTWLRQHYPNIMGNDRVEFCDAKDLLRQIKPGSVNVIATEPYLGPPQRGNPTGHAILPLVSALSKQYAVWIRAMSEVLRDGGRLAMIWPFYRIDKHGYFLQLQDAVRGAGLRPIVPPAWLVEKPWFRSTPRGTILYSRPDQIVGREIALLEKHAP